MSARESKPFWSKPVRQSSDVLDSYHYAMSTRILWKIDNGSGMKRPPGEPRHDLFPPPPKLISFVGRNMGSLRAHILAFLIEQTILST
jgi:hypothetical protein